MAIGKRRHPPLRMTPELYAKAWAAYQVAQTVSNVATSCGLADGTARKLIARGYPDHGYTALVERYRAEQLRRQALERFPAMQARAEGRQLFATQRASLQELADMFADNLAKIRRRIDEHRQPVGVEIADDHLWGAHRALSASARDLAALEEAFYGDMTENEGPTIVVVRDLGAEPVPQANEATAQSPTGNGTSNSGAGNGT